MPYPYLGTDTRTYTQYLNIADWTTLVAEPGGTYDMVTVPGSGGVPVPPGDGCWGESAALAVKDEPDGPKAAPLPAKTKPAAGAAKEG